MCDSLKGRIKLHAAVYRHSHDDQSRVWLTFDKKQIFSAADLTYNIQQYQREQELKEQRQLKPIPYNEGWEVMFYSPERMALLEASNFAEEELLNEGILGTWHLYQRLLKYPNLSIEEALTLDDPIIRAFALFDRRVGKRRLLQMQHFLSPIEQQCYQIRCEVEKLQSK